MLKDAFKFDNLESYRGKKVGIDGMGWLYQAFYSVSESIDKIHMPLVRKMEARFKLLEKHNINFVVIIDGHRLEGKRHAMEKRRAKREQYQESARQMEDDPDCGQQAVYEKYAQEVTVDLVYFFIDYLKFKNFKYIVAPYEADAQLAYMAKRKLIDYIAAEDSDFFALNCFNILRNIKPEGTCQVVDSKMLAPSKSETVTLWDKFYALSDQRRTLMCVMNGCDYIDNFKGIGFISLVTFFYEHRALADAAFEKEMETGLLHKYPEQQAEFVASCKLILNAFNAQVVYDPESRKLVNMGLPIGPKTDTPTYTGLKFAEFPDFVTGALDFKTLKPRLPVEHDFERMIRFVNQTTLGFIGGMSNLCCQQFTYAAFMDGHYYTQTATNLDRAEEKMQSRPARSLSRPKAVRGKSTECSSRVSGVRSARSCSRAARVVEAKPARSASRPSRPAEARPARSYSRPSLKGKSCDRTTRVSWTQSVLSGRSRDLNVAKRCKAN